MLGDGRLALQCFDNETRTGLIRGTMRRRVWINTVRIFISKKVMIVMLLCVQGDIVLVGLREFQPEKADVIHKYTTDEARNLQAYGELPANARINQTAVDMAMDDGEEEEDVGFDFDDVSVLSICLNPLFMCVIMGAFCCICRYKCSPGFRWHYVHGVSFNSLRLIIILLLNNSYISYAHEILLLIIL